VIIKLLNVLNGTFLYMSWQKYTSKARKVFKMRILYAQTLILVLWELWQELEKSNFLHGKPLYLGNAIPIWHQFLVCHTLLFICCNVSHRWHIKCFIKIINITLHWDLSDFLLNCSQHGLRKLWRFTHYSTA